MLVQYFGKRFGDKMWYHVDSFIDYNVLYFAHLDEACVLSARGIAGGQLNTQGTNHKQGLMVYLHKVNVEHHSNQGNDYGAGQYCSVLKESNIHMLFIMNAMHA